MHNFGMCAHCLKVVRVIENMNKYKKCIIYVKVLALFD